MNSNSRRRTTSRKSSTGSFSLTGGSWGRTSSSPSGRARKSNVRGAGCAPGYSSICSTFENKVRGFRVLCEQTRGTAKRSRPSPATLKSFGNWINKGANVFKVTNTQLNKWCTTNQSIKSTTSAKNVLCKKFGKSTIKAVACAKTGGFIVATAPTCQGKTFTFPK